jgi:hypothetical protein
MFGSNLNPPTMKRSLLTLLLLPGMALATLAQNEGVNFGVIAGYNNSSYDTGSLLGNKPRAGMYLGGTMLYAVEKNREIAGGYLVELQYVTRGALEVLPDLTTSTYGLTYEGMTDHKISSLDLAVGSRFNIIWPQFYLEGLFNFSFLVGKKITGDGVPPEIQTWMEDGYKGTTIGFKFGLGYLHKSGIGITARGGFNFTDFFQGQPPSPDPNSYAWEETKDVSDQVQIGLMYYFNQNN